MSGHNKWSKIKNAKEKNDQQNAKMFTKIGREIAVAVKLGGPDPNANTQLKNIIAKAKSINMPNDNINRSIKKASGELNTVNYESMTYEGYGIGGSAVIVYALTDNKNRTASDVRHLFDKFGGSLGSNGCVSYLFTKKGVIYVQKGTGISDDDIMMMALDAGAEDILIEDDVYEIYTTPDTFDEVRDNLEKAGVTIADSGLDMIPSNYVTLPEDKVATFQKMIDFLEDSDDVQEVYHNVELPDEELERNMYWYVKNTLENNGYNHYEISNYSKPGRRSRHNMLYWNLADYIGVGAAAHSYFDGVRYSNTDNVEEYISSAIAGNCDRVQSEVDAEFEYVMLKARLSDGFLLSEFEERFGSSFTDGKERLLAKFQEQGFMTISDERIALTENGFYLSNSILVEIL